MKPLTRDKKVTQIRKRATYHLFKQLHAFLNKEPCVPDVLRRFYDILDAKKTFGSRRNAERAAESLDWVLRDNGEIDDEPLEQERPDEDGMQTTLMAQDIAQERPLGNFVLVDFFSEVQCCHGHKTRTFKIGRDRYVACDECRAYILFGSNLLDCWPPETTDIWLANRKSVKSYELIK